MSGAMERTAVSFGLVARDLARNRFAVALVFLIPTLFYLLIYATTGAREVPFELSAMGPEPRTASERDLSILFIGMAAISGIAAFLSFVLVLKPSTTDRRLVFEGFRPAELLVAKLLVTVAAAVLVALYATVLLLVFFRPERVAGVFLGFLLTALVYGVLGIAVGAVARRDLEGILFILLLVNIDAGWLQNPLFYGQARNRELIRLLPGHHPGQVSMLSAFTDGGLLVETARALAWAAVALVVAGVLYWRRVRVLR